MNSRIDMLLSTFHLESRKWGRMKESELFEINYDHVTAILQYERGKAIAYLKDALGMEIK
ncbi:hypothetical protein D3C79_1115030 [compost metagenome]